MIHRAPIEIRYCQEKKSIGMREIMKNKINLFYGSIIGFLVFACVGAKSGGESTEKQFSEMKVVYPFMTSSITNDKLDELGLPKEGRSKAGGNNSQGKPWMKLKGFATEVDFNYYEAETLVLATLDTSPQALVDAGWTIVDMEFEPSRGKQAYLIGK